MTAALAQINALYDYASSGNVTAFEAESVLLDEFCGLHHKLQRAAQANKDDLLLEEAIRLSGRLRYRLLGAPLPLNHPGVIDHDTATALQSQIAMVSRSYSELFETCARYASALQELQACSENPLWRAVESNAAHEEAGAIGLLIKPSKLIQHVQELANSAHRQIRAVTESTLRQSDVFDRLYVFGAGRWYADFVFSAPRAPNIYIFRYAMLNDRPPERATFLKPLSSSKRRMFSPSPRRTDSSSQIEADEIQPTLDIASIIRRAARSEEADVNQDAAEVTEARALLLEQELAVLVHASEGASELIVDPREEAEKLVQRVPVSELEPGMAILVRTVGGGDLVVLAADQVLGAKAQRLREAQRQWKKQLRDLVVSRGSAAVVNQLKAAGSAIASHQNLRNWMSHRSIRTERREDFDAIFRMIGADNEVQAFWEKMAVIDVAHRKAGQLIRRLLLEQVRDADLSLLKTQGRQDFVLPGNVGGGLSAIRIVSISPEAVEAHPAALHRLIELGD